ncbi:hypothetical protein KIH74_25610 [Kineosporia sp. J2-2]|uniref:UDP-N-acetyl-alpha-D-muramoyl-L-alanyl-L-glutamate epimerase n=1 Tax=Kineosporia corallincola TaxID=2835133 RepID=A0ABS5TMN6_9ACTN|nr:hypothetical protein [Kineosporia corallincola]MBT0772347.1 hypothetical protein [Kineosporia corallincola]
MTAPGPTLETLRRENPTFTVAEPRTATGFGRLDLLFHFTVGEHVFTPTVSLHGLTEAETARVRLPPARALLRAIALVESFSYWKAFCSPELRVPPAPDAAEIAWWEAFWPSAMGEFFYRNQIDFTTPGFLDVTADQAPPAPARESPADGPALVMFSGGKDSLALALTTRRVMPADFFVYNPTPGQLGLTASLTAGGGRVFRVERAVLPELLALNQAGHPNGHTPYSAHLAFTAMLVGFLRGSSLVLAGNARSDDEPNISAYLGRPVNHQWTKTYEFEAALGDYRDRWAPGAPRYASPLRPLYELQVISLLVDDVEAFLRTASCNRTRGQGWCRECAKCAWVFLATSVLFGHPVAVGKLGGDLFGNIALAGLYERMAGLHGTKPFECTGSEDEVRAALREVLERDPAAGPPKALLVAAEDARIRQARPLAAVLGEWGADDLVPERLLPLVRAARR